ncbi:MAG: NAD(P)H-binding protein [Gammaproteobacteria bacterium]|nr:NAD(P)H-binding protein [Gammaproteobacteria bacterium]NNF60809.1 NAD(P)H-binding protein [Gammaproteobacteria bacterium]NNM21726.1 NAD(P)H-binding protein [Gammaproteobacteria bacterium]
MSRHALLAGATGLVGGRLLAQLAAQGGYTVTTVGRRAPAFEHQCVTHLVTDFSGTVEVPAADTFFCCLGTTIRKAGSQDAFRAIDLDLVVKLAAAARAAGCTTAVIVSSVGADASSSSFYLRIKGEMEISIENAGFTGYAFIRPSLLLGERAELRPAELLGKWATRLINPLLAGRLSNYRAVNADTVAAAMIGLDRTGITGRKIVQGRQIERLAATARP